jgi:hypothetical protein
MNSWRHLRQRTAADVSIISSDTISHPVSMYSEQIDVNEDDLNWQCTYVVI